MGNVLREAALRLLARREHTRHEISRKLAPLAESEKQLETLLDELTQRGWLSDERYVVARYASRAARYGDARVAYELRARGVSDELVDHALAAGESELTRARRIWQRRFGRQAAAASDAAELSRQTRFLAARGFSAETIRRLLRAPIEDE